MAETKKDTYYNVTYRDQKDSSIIQLKAKNVTDSSLGLSFIAISDFIFDSGTLVVNPQEEDMKKRFEGVKTYHLSIYTIISIEEVGREHTGLSFKKDKSNLLVLPGSSPTQGK